MAIKKEIVIEIGPDGQIKMEAHGFKGADCDEEPKAMAGAIGKIISTKHNGEFFQKKTGAANLSQKKSGSR